MFSLTRLCGEAAWVTMIERLGRLIERPAEGDWFAGKPAEFAARQGWAHGKHERSRRGEVNPQIWTLDQELGTLSYGREAESTP